MNAKQANQVSIKSYLKSIGISPIRSYKSYSLYRSPYRADKSPSMKVSHQENLWIDFGDNNKGGTLIDLVLRIYPCKTTSEAINEIESSAQFSFSFHQHDALSPKLTEISERQEKRSIRIQKVQDLGNNLAITDYLISRGIQVQTAKDYCNEVYFTVGDKRYFGIGNQNDKGWSIRNKYWKGCTSQGFSIYKKGYQKLNVFEGIFDLLSFIELNRDNPIQADSLVLNSLVNLKRAIPIVENYIEANLFLDHDISGGKATTNLLEQLSNTKDASSFYSLHKDLNDYYLIKVKEQLIKNDCTPRVNEASHVLARPKRLLR